MDIIEFNFKRNSPYDSVSFVFATIQDHKIFVLFSLIQGYIVFPD